MRQQFGWNIFLREKCRDIVLIHEDDFEHTHKHTHTKSLEQLDEFELYHIIDFASFKQTCN